MAEAIIAETAGTASGSLNPLSGARAKMLEDAMILATEACAESGIVDPAEILAAKLEARQAMQDEFAALDAREG